MTSSDHPINQSRVDSEIPAPQESEGPKVNVHYDTRLPKLPWSRRMQIPFIAAAVYSVIRILGPTLRFEAVGTDT